MLSKVVAVAAFVLLPFSLSLWHKSYANPEHFRFDVTLYKSLRIYLRNGGCGFRLLSMPTRTASASEFRAPMAHDPVDMPRSLVLTTTRKGPYRVSWLVFPLWLSTLALTVCGMLPVIRGPVRRRWRRWHGACTECGYNLRGNRSGRCPECGTRFR